MSLFPEKRSFSYAATNVHIRPLRIIHRLQYESSWCVHHFFFWFARRLRLQRFGAVWWWFLFLLLHYCKAATNLMFPLLLLKYRRWVCSLVWMFAEFAPYSRKQGTKHLIFPWINSSQLSWINIFWWNILTSWSCIVFNRFSGHKWGKKGR